MHAHASGRNAHIRHRAHDIKGMVMRRGLRELHRGGVTFGRRDRDDLKASAGTILQRLVKGGVKHLLIIDTRMVEFDHHQRRSCRGHLLAIYLA